VIRVQEFTVLLINVVNPCYSFLRISSIRKQRFKIQTKTDFNLKSEALFAVTIRSEAVYIFRRLWGICAEKGKYLITRRHIPEDHIVTVPNLI
jgi:hypothetical protein